MQGPNEENRHEHCLLAVINCTMNRIRIEITSSDDAGDVSGLADKHVSTGNMPHWESEWANWSLVKSHTRPGLPAMNRRLSPKSRLSRDPLEVHVRQRSHCKVSSEYERWTDVSPPRHQRPSQKQCYKVLNVPLKATLAPLALSDTSKAWIKVGRV